MNQAGMNPGAPLPERDSTVAILMGASEWPYYPALEPSIAHTNSAREFREYLRALEPDGLGLPAQNVLDLFDNEASVIDQDELVRKFLEDRARERPIADLLLFYTGHGGFTTGDEYYLAIRSTKRSNSDITGYKIRSLGRALNELAAQARRIIFLDCCFAGAAAGEIIRLDDPLPSMVAEVEAALPKSGTALFCAASRKSKARIIAGESHTMFGGSLVEILKRGDAKLPARFTVGDLGRLLDTDIRQRYVDLAVKPEVHYPDQRDGTLSELAIFPNPATAPRNAVVLAPKSEFDLDRAASEALLEAADRLNSQTALPTLLRDLLAIAERIVRCESASVILYDPGRQDLHFAAASGPAADKVANLRIPHDKGIAGKVFATGESVVEDNIASYYAEVDKKTDYQTKSMICVPLKFGQTIFGVLQLLNKLGNDGAYVAYDKRDLYCAERIATQAAIALRNAIQFENLLASIGLLGSPEIRGDLMGMITDPKATPRREAATIMFADMRGFSMLSQILNSSQTISETLTAFLEIVTDAIVTHDGIVNKFLGDGVLAIFRGENGAKNAIRCAFAMRERCRSLFQEWARGSNHDLSFLEVGFGISTDEVTFGLVGSGYARDFTVIGPAVNLAARLQNNARDGRWVLCDNRTYQLVQDIVAKATGPEPFRSGKIEQGGRPGYMIYCLEALAAP